MDRAAFLSGTAASAAAFTFPKGPLAELEVRHGGRLGIAALNSGTGTRIAHRAGERFPMCSTFKVLLAAAVLARVDAGSERLGRHIPYTKRDLLEYAPVTTAHAYRGFMTVQALCEAAVEYSDNTAADLLLRSIGGPAHVTAYARSLGDSVTRLDRNEPTLNTAIPGDPRDTTTPIAMLATFRKLVRGNVLSRASQGKLDLWLMQCKTGTGRIRAGVPAGWRVGDKTGSGDHATSNDIAVLYPPGRAPIFVMAYYTGASASGAARDAVLAEVGRIVSRTLA